jgi:hypothetical protein
VVVETSNREEPTFEASSPGCRTTIGPGEVCHYVITVNHRPERAGSVTIYYRGTGAEKTLSVPVTIEGEELLAVLEASPSSVSIERLQSNGSFVVRNTGSGTATAYISRIDVEGVTPEEPEFEVAEPGCTLILVHGASCTYIVVVNGRPLREGHVIFSYLDDVNRAERRMTVRVDIEA